MRLYIALVIASFIKPVWRAALMICLAAQAGAALAQGSSRAGVPSEEEAPIALLVDVTSGQVLFERDADRRFMPASMTKVMTMFLAFELIKAGELDLGGSFTMSGDLWEEWNGQGSTMWLPNEEPVSVTDLLMGIANISANDGSILLANGQAGSVDAWLDAMNSKAREIRMTNSHFGTPNGWPDEGKTFTTARDLVTLGRALTDRHPDLFARFMGKPGFTYNGITQPNRDPMLGRVTGADGIKTGYTNEAGFGFLGTAKRDDQRLIMVIGAVQRNSQRARLSRALMEWGFANFERKQFFSKGAAVGKARVQDGASRHVELVTDRDVFVNIPNDQATATHINILYDGPLRAPIAAGDEIATLEIKVPGMKPALVPLIARENIKKAGFFSRIYNGFAGWFE